MPLATGMAWYLAGYNTFAAVESLALQYGVRERGRRWLLPLATALTATSSEARPGRWRYVGFSLLFPLVLLLALIGRRIPETMD